MLPLRQSTGGQAGSFLVAADDGKRYWCKPLNNLQSPRVPITEQIVGRLGRLIGVGVCEPQLVLLDGLAGWEFRAGHFVDPGWAHGSLAVEPVLETRSLDFRPADDNRRRHAGFFALHDWLAGSDAQWLYDTSADNMYFSHDHGFYLAGPAWTTSSLTSRRGETFVLSLDRAGLDTAEIGRLSDRLDQLTRDEIEVEVFQMPASWPVGDDELTAVTDFADQRRPGAAERLRRLLP